MRPVAPEDFILRTAKRLHEIKKPSLTVSELAEFKANVSCLEFSTGRPSNSNCPELLTLRSVRDIRNFVNEVEPCIEDGTDEWRNFVPETPFRSDSEAMGCYRSAKYLSTIVQVWLDAFPKKWPKTLDIANKRRQGTLLRQTDWRERSDRAAESWLGADDEDKYIWRSEITYHGLLPIEYGQGKPPCDPNMPHAIYHAVDSTPFDDPIIRMSEFKSIVFLAIVNNMKPGYNNLDCFGVTVLSFWKTSVRIVQGLVNLKTRNIDPRVSKIQDFSNGFWNDGVIDDRFLALLAYNCGEVVPLRK
ncbi:hypothetical protein LMH87_009419 [Akanthomyces muscarius]|uniref:Uncharacterized protein n=1 Tax=Akanthomyces muscarius TaxID=2231603 RepID=A0A9W8QBC1_AKAMU|nr:hypothetical protein LMH87_009419 [Akanthomyces muscarius]KAJ4152900.1 hypothetical protein LMH87_009419 [Akanthomyces muscarius]